MGLRFRTRIVRMVACLAILITVYIFLIQSGTVQFIYSHYLDIKRLSYQDINFESWSKDTVSACSGNFQGFSHRYALLKNVALEPKASLFEIPCETDIPQYTFSSGKEGTHLNDWIQSVVVYRDSQDRNFIQSSNFVIAVKRYEYVNLYHTMTDWYNAFIMLKLFNKTSVETSIMLFDKQKGTLDETWVTLFGEIILRQDIQTTLKVKEMAWSILGYESPLNYRNLRTVPYIEDFHRFFIQRHGIEQTKPLDCKKMLILFLWRRDYVAHSGNPTGLISRKIKNEEELVTLVQNMYPQDEVVGHQLDLFDMKEQLRWITRADILISMHGAGLSHILFLPRHAGVLELFPNYSLSHTHLHFKAMARWRGVWYRRWQNWNPANEHSKFYTYVPPLSFQPLIKELHNEICPQ